MNYDFKTIPKSFIPHQNLDYFEMCKKIYDPIVSFILEKLKIYFNELQEEKDIYNSKIKRIKELENELNRINKYAAVESKEIDFKVRRKISPPHPSCGDIEYWDYMEAFQNLTDNELKTGDYPYLKKKSIIIKEIENLKNETEIPMNVNEDIKQEVCEYFLNKLDYIDTGHNFDFNFNNENEIINLEAIKIINNIENNLIKNNEANML